MDWILTESVLHLVAKAKRGIGPTCPLRRPDRPCLPRRGTAHTHERRLRRLASVSLFRLIRLWLDVDWRSLRRRVRRHKLSLFLAEMQVNEGGLGVRVA